jgi:hypothetical protein
MRKAQGRRNKAGTLIPHPTLSLCQLEDFSSFQILFEKLAEQTVQLMLEKFALDDKSRDNNEKSHP